MKFDRILYAFRCIWLRQNLVLHWGHSRIEIVIHFERRVHPARGTGWKSEFEKKETNESDPSLLVFFGWRTFHHRWWWLFYPSLWCESKKAAAHIRVKASSFSKSYSVLRVVYSSLLFFFVLLPLSVVDLSLCFLKGMATLTSFTLSNNQYPEHRNENGLRGYCDKQWTSRGVLFSFQFSKVLRLFMTARCTHFLQSLLKSVCRFTM